MHSFFFFFNLFSFSTVVGLCWHAQAFSSCKQVPLSSCYRRASHCGGFSWCRAQVPVSWASGVLVHSLSYPMACGIFPDQESNQCPPRISRWILNHQAIKEVLRVFSMHVASSVITTKPACRGKGIQPPRGMILAVTFRPKEDHGGAQYHFAEQAECYYSEPNKGLAHRYLE